MPTHRKAKPRRMPKPKPKLRRMLKPKLRLTPKPRPKQKPMRKLKLLRKPKLRRQSVNEWHKKLERKRRLKSWHAKKQRKLSRRLIVLEVKFKAEWPHLALLTIPISKPTEVFAPVECLVVPSWDPNLVVVGLATC